MGRYCKALNARGMRLNLKATCWIITKEPEPSERNPQWRKLLQGLPPRNGLAGPVKDPGRAANTCRLC